MAVNKAMMSSEKENWQTPNEVFWPLDEVFHFDLDAAASLGESRCPIWIDKDDDCNVVEWGAYGPASAIWCNPPYGKFLSRTRFMAKVCEEAQTLGLPILCLLPARTDTKWFQHAWRADAICFMRGRIKFVGAKNGATFPSVLVGWNLQTKHYEVLKTFGHVVCP